MTIQELVAKCGGKDLSGDDGWIVPTFHIGNTAEGKAVILHDNETGTFTVNIVDGIENASHEDFILETTDYANMHVAMESALSKVVKS